MPKKNEKLKDPMLPLTWTGWDGDHAECLILYNPVFIEDFGPVKKGDSFDSAALITQSAKLELYNEAGNVLHTIQVRITPK